MTRASSPRPEAGQHHAGGGQGQGPGLRPGQGVRHPYCECGRCQLPDDGEHGRHQRRRHPGNRGVHVARAGQGTCRRSADRHLRVRVRPRRDAHGEEGVRRRGRHRHSRRGPQSGARLEPASRRTAGRRSPAAASLHREESAESPQRCDGYPPRSRSPAERTSGRSTRADRDSTASPVGTRCSRGLGARDWWHSLRRCDMGIAAGSRGGRAYAFCGHAASGSALFRHRTQVHRRFARRLGDGLTSRISGSTFARCPSWRPGRFRERKRCWLR